MQILKPKPRYRINYKAVSNHLGVKLRGNETFDELLKIEQQVKWRDSKDNPNASFREDEKREREANIQRVDAQTKKYWGKK
jgi:hypothetical protein